MAQLIADRRDIDFVLYEQLNTEALTRHERFAGYNKKTFDMIITEARNFAIKELLPVNAEGDRIGVHLENGQVKVPECFHRPYKLFLEGEWTSLTEDPELGGQGLPVNIARAVAEYMVGANNSLVNYGLFGHGTGKMIELFGTEEQKELYLKKLYTGEWGGTMLLTEAESGSDLNLITSTAEKQPDGTYLLNGTKIFITNGDHDLSENIIHPVLARVEGAPKGTKGISIFIVPKIMVNPDGSLGEPNGIVCTGIEEKMGIHASATCTLAMGGKTPCRGFLLGEENQGMRIMFHMMNEARLAVGFQGFAFSSAAYLCALNYAKERIQGYDIEAGKGSPSVPIICHPDVRRMLLWMKAHVDGMRSFMYYAGECLENIGLAETEEEKAFYQGLADLFIPVVKAYSADRGFEICSQAMQVYGGYGYTKEYPVEQYTRDAKIASIYEGTNGIQAMDLLGRKMTMNQGKAFMDFLGELKKIVTMAKEMGETQAMADEVKKAANRLGEVAMHLGTVAMAGEVKKAFAHATPFLEVMGDVIMAWMLLWRAAVASKKLAEGANKKDIDFYHGQVKTAEFFIYTILPGTLGKMDAIKIANNAANEMSEAHFGG
jgi:alkylation response protein AidB-like acyl-CoA dehydrogenase